MANVSLATVSNVVNRKFGKMTDETRNSVEKAITALNYRPMANARALRLEKRFIAGMLIIDPAASFLANPFISQLVAGYSNALWVRGYSCLINGVRPNQVEDSTFVRYAQTDGLCVYQTGPTTSRLETLRRLAALGEPVLAIEEPNLPDGDIAAVRQDNYAAAVALANEMVRRQARALWILVPSWIWPAMQTRIDGITDAARAHGTPVHVVPCGDGPVAAAEVAISQLLKGLGPEDCMIAGTDRMFVGMIHSVTRMKSSRQPLIAGFRGIGDAPVLPPGVVTIHQPAYELGAEAARRLMDRIDNGVFSQTESTMPFTRELLVVEPDYRPPHQRPV